jgi:hypothetical protein
MSVRGINHFFSQNVVELKRKKSFYDNDIKHIVYVSLLTVKYFRLKEYCYFFLLPVMILIDQ